MEASADVLTAAAAEEEDDMRFVFKLFGRTISLPPPHAAEMTDSGEELSREECSPNSSKTIDSPRSDEKQRRTHRSSSSSIEEANDTQFSKEKSTLNFAAIQEKKEKGAKNSAKKPNKILPCPRCNSIETKFCYYNNYKINQPRHFCKNCQRYWTSGGGMRNVPVGSGRRKSKSSSFSVSGGRTHFAIPFLHSASHHYLYPNSRVLNFISGSPNNGRGEIPRLISVNPETVYWNFAPAAFSPSPPVNFSPVFGKNSTAKDEQIEQNRGIEPENKNNETSEDGNCLWVPKTSATNIEELEESEILKLEMVHRANPAAWSRSMNFQERS